MAGFVLFTLLNAAAQTIVCLCIPREGSDASNELCGILLVKADVFRESPNMVQAENKSTMMQAENKNRMMVAIALRMCGHSMLS